MELRTCTRRTAVALLTAAAAGLAACGPRDNAQVVTGPWNDVVQAATKEAQVDFYTSFAPTQNSRLVDAFHKQYPGIRVNVTHGAGELGARVDPEIQSQSDGADVLVYADPAWYGKNEGQLLAVNGPSANGWRADSWTANKKAVIPSIYPNTLFRRQLPEGVRRAAAQVLSFGRAAHPGCRIRRDRRVSHLRSGDGQRTQGAGRADRFRPAGTGLFRPMGCGGPHELRMAERCSGLPGLHHVGYGADGRQRRRLRRRGSGRYQGGTYASRLHSPRLQAIHPRSDVRIGAAARPVPGVSAQLRETRTPKGNG